MPNAPPTPATALFRAERTDPASQRPMSLRDVLTGIFYHSRAIGLTLGLALGAGLLAAVLMRPTYRAGTRLLALDSAAYGASLAPSEKFSAEQSLQPYRIADIEMQMLGSSEISHDAAELNLPPGADPAAVAIEARRIAGHMHIGRPIDSPVIELNYSDSSPTAARETLQHILAAHLARRGASLTAGRFDYIFRQRAELDAQRKALDARILAYEHAHHLEDTESARAGAVNAAFAVDLARSELSSQLAGSRDAMARLRAASRNTTGDAPLLRDSAPAVASLASLRREETRQIAARANLAARYLSGSPALQAADAALAETDAAILQAIPQLPAARESGPDPVAEASAQRLALAEAQAAGDAARRDALARQSAQAHRRLDQLLTDTTPLTRMRQERQLLEDTYAGLSQQLEDARKFETPDQIGSANLRVLSPPEVTGRSNSPAMLVAASLFGGLLVAANVVLVLASLRNSFLTPAEVERALGVPVLFAPSARDDTPREQQPNLHRLLAAIHHARPITRGVVVAIAALGGSEKARKFSSDLLQAVERRAQGRSVLVRLDDTAPLPAAMPPAGDTSLSVHPLEASGGTILDQLAQRFDTVLMIAPAAGNDSAMPALAQSADLAVLVLTAGVSSRAQAVGLERSWASHGVGAVVAVLLERHHTIPLPLYRLLFGRGNWRSGFGKTGAQAAQRNAFALA